MSDLESIARGTPRVLKDAYQAGAQDARNGQSLALVVLRGAARGLWVGLTFVVPIFLNILRSSTRMR